jgi:uncharacterized protein (DUF952 family)
MALKLRKGISTRGRRRRVLDVPRSRRDHPRDIEPADTMAKIIYKICEVALWRQAERASVFRGASVDIRDGFIHFSSASQVRATAAKHFLGVDDLMLMAIDADALGDALKWEVSRGGELFPHLYGELPLGAVLWVKPLPLGIDRQHVFPELPA